MADLDWTSERRDQDITLEEERLVDDRLELDPASRDIADPGAAEHIDMQPPETETAESASPALERSNSADYARPSTRLGAGTTPTSPRRESTLDAETTRGPSQQAPEAERQQALSQAPAGGTAIRPPASSSERDAQQEMTTFSASPEVGPQVDLDEAGRKSKDDRLLSKVDDLARDTKQLLDKEEDGGELDLSDVSVEDNRQAAGIKPSEPDSEPQEKTSAPERAQTPEAGSEPSEAASAPEREAAPPTDQSEPAQESTADAQKAAGFWEGRLSEYAEPTDEAPSREAPPMDEPAEKSGTVPKAEPVELRPLAASARDATTRGQSAPPSRDQAPVTSRVGRQADLSRSAMSREAAPVDEAASAASVTDAATATSGAGMAPGAGPGGGANIQDRSRTLSGTASLLIDGVPAGQLDLSLQES